MKRAALILVLVSMFAATGCAILERDNLRAFNWVERNMTPESTAMKVMLTPVLVPVGLGALALDQFVLHPVSVLDDAADDILDLFWGELWSRKYVTGCAGLGWWALPLTPVAFTFNWLARCVFDIPHNNGYKAQRDPIRDEG